MLTRRQVNIGLAASATLVATNGLASAQEAFDLLPPRSEGGKPLIDALRLRRSVREYSPRPLPAQVLSDLLWGAFGNNRPVSGDRTAPYWRHIMVIDIYAAMKDGVSLYEPKEHKLIRHLRGDIRAETGTQDLVSKAPLNLIYVAHGERMGASPPRIDGYTHRSIPALLGKTSTCFAARRGLRLLSGIGRLRQAGPNRWAGNRAVHHLCPEHRISAT